MARWQLINDIVYEVTDETATTHKMLKSLVVMGGILTHGERYMAQRLVFAHNAAEAQRKRQREWLTVDQFAAQPDAGYFDNALIAGLDTIKSDPWLYGYYDDKIKSVEQIEQMMRNRGITPWVDVKHNENVDLRELPNDGMWVF